MRGLIVTVLGMLAVFLAAAPGLAQDTLAQDTLAQDTVALTFDDLPSLTLLSSQAYVDRTNMLMLRGLKRNHMPAIGFVNEGKLDEGNRAHQIADLRAWIEAGMDLGNHTFSHESPNTLSTRAYIADIARGEKRTRPLLAAHHKALVWFRYPYLETGSTEPEKAAIAAWLEDHGYRVAPVTMENSDWMFAEPYDDAIARHQPDRVRRIRAEYLAYTEDMVAWYQAAGHGLFGRPMAFVMLLHLTRLNADCIDDLAAILARHHIEPVSLDAAMKDPAYKIKDSYVGSDGLNWLERWSPALHKDLSWATFKDPPADIQAEDEALDNDQ